MIPNPVVLARVLGLLMVTAIPVAAQDLGVSGSVSVELRGFFQAPQFPGQLDHVQPSLVFAPELQLRTDDRRHQFKVTPFVRLDAADPDRTHVDLREAFWRGIFGDWELLVGANVVFWGVTESRHLVDVVNQTDVREDIDEEDKLGQPMINIEWQRPWGRVSGLLLLGFREQRFPGLDGRLRGPLPVDTNQALFPDAHAPSTWPCATLTSSATSMSGVYAFHGTGREPAFRVNDTGTDLLPVYRTITQLGLDLQYTRDAWLWKLEAIGRAGEGTTFGAFVAGVEHTRYQVFGSAADLGFLSEYLYDGRDGAAPPTAFSNHGFVGARLALNDTQDTSLLVGAVVDLEDGTVAALVESERRLTNRFKLELESRLFGRVDQRNALQSFRNDSFVTVRVSLFF